MLKGGGFYLAVICLYLLVSPSHNIPAIACAVPNRFYPQVLACPSSDMITYHNTHPPGTNHYAHLFCCSLQQN